MGTRSEVAHFDRIHFWRSNSIPYIHVHTHTHTQILVRVHEQFELFVAKDLSNVDHQLLMGVLKTLAKIGPRADPVFRDECEY